MQMCIRDRDKGVQETMKDGIIAGYPLTGIRVAVYDGSYHSVDSNEMAFRAAARIGLRKDVYKRQAYASERAPGAVR